TSATSNLQTYHLSYKLTLSSTVNRSYNPSCQSKIMARLLDCKPFISSACKSVSLYNANTFEASTIKENSGTLNFFINLFVILKLVIFKAPRLFQYVSKDRQLGDNLTEINT